MRECLNKTIFRIREDGDITGACADIFGVCVKSIKYRKSADACENNKKDATAPVFFEKRSAMLQKKEMN